MYGFGVDQMVVVEDHGDLSGERGDLVDQGARQGVYPRRLGGTQGGRNLSPTPSWTVLSAATSQERKRAGSLSPSSNDTQAASRSLAARSSNHSTNRVVLPKPASALTSVSLGTPVCGA